MGLDIVRQIYHISKKCNVEKIVILTNHLKFVGNLYTGDDIKKNSDDIITLSDVKMWRISDICNCKESSCSCDEETFLPMDWAHINVHKIAAFSLLK